VYQKLHELNSILHDTRGNNQQLNRSDFPDGEDNGEHGQLAELDKMMQRLNTAGSAGNDSSMQQINNVLEKVLDVQYPQRMREKLQKQSALHTGQVFAVTTPDFTSTISLLDTGGGTDKNSTAFFSAREEAEDSSLQRGIEAVVHETQTLVNGAIVKMRLMDDIFINGQLVSRGNFIFGTATLNNERLEIAISSVRNGNSLLPVKLDVYDMDGIRGIYIPGAITRDVAKQSSDNALQSIALSSLDPSIGTQAASAGIETAKNLLTKRIKIVRVLIKAGYKILLKDNNQP
jgi:conjugative transposon TraM protein